MCPGGAHECFVAAATLAAGSHAEMCKPAFAATGPRAGRAGRPAAPAPGASTPYFFFGAAAPASAEPAPRIALKKSLLESMTITSDFLLKLAR